MSKYQTQVYKVIQHPFSLSMYKFRPTRYHCVHPRMAKLPNAEIPSVIEDVETTGTLLAAAGAAEWSSLSRRQLG